MKIIWVKWLDAAFELRDLHQTEVDGYEVGSVMETVGFLVRQDKKGLILADDWQPEQEKWRGIMSIPRALSRKSKE